jgi:23S rRNA-/tRNA-specific pseudouridylate synthase
MIPTNREDALLLSVSEAWVGKRLDLAAAELADVTRSAATRLIEDGAVTVNGKAVAKNSPKTKQQAGRFADSAAAPIDAAIVTSAWKNVSGKGNYRIGSK